MKIPNFTPTEFSTNEDKQKFAKHFIKFVSNGYKYSQFPKWFYTRLSVCRGHIAHYNQQGFYDTWFDTKEAQSRFINHWLMEPIYGDASYTYSDVERFLSAWINENL